MDLMYFHLLEMDDQNPFTELENLLPFLRYEASKLGLTHRFWTIGGPIRFLSYCILIILDNGASVPKR